MSNPLDLRQKETGTVFLLEKQSLSVDITGNSSEKTTEARHEAQQQKEEG